MRITQNSILNNLITETNKNRNRWADLQRQISTSLKVSRPSDEPFSFASGNELKSQIDRNRQYQSNIDSGLEQSRIVQDTIDQMIEQMYTVKSTATKGANGAVLTDSDFETLADNIAAVKETLLELGNLNAKGRYMMGGTATQTRPFGMDGLGNITFNGNNSNLTVKVNGTSEVNISVNGEEFFDYGFESVFDLLSRIETNMRNSDGDAVNADLQNVTDAIEHMANQAGNLGNGINRLEYAYQQIENTTLRLEERKSRLLDTDYAEAISEIQQLDIAYNSALALTSRVGNLSLLNYL